MKIIGTTFEKLPRERLEIGFKGENLRATVRIDCASVFAEYPNATPALIVKPLFADAYPVVVDRNGTDVDWLITSEILSFSGDGEIQLVFYKDEVICKSAVSKIRVCRSLQVTGTMPDPVAQWIDDANRKLAEVDAQIVELEEMVDTATDAAERAEQSASTASAKAEQAAGSAATATAKATEATNAAGTATAKAAEAALSATQARNSAVSAADSERIATAKAGEATTAAETATAKAEQATEAAQTATEKAGDASASATAAHASEINAAESADDALSAEVGANAAKRAAEASATQAAQSAQGASAYAQTATQKAAEAQQSATGATQSEQTATQKAGEAAASAQAASDAKTAVEQTAEQLADSLEQIAQNTQDIAELDERKANIDGYYPDMTVGNAEQLNSSKFVENSEPYTLRTSGGSSDIGNREYLDAVVGGTLAWNQMVRDEASENQTDFAPIVTVTDAVEDAAGVKVKIEPVQDLHGYDYPWPAGGGVNKLSINADGFNFTTWTEYNQTTEKYTIKQGQGIVPNSIPVNEIIPVGTDITVSIYIESGMYTSGTISIGGYHTGDTKLWQGYVTLPKNVDLTNKIYTQAVTTTEELNAFEIFLYGNPTVTSNIVFRAQIELGTNNSPSWHPYSNICPITGWDGVQVWDDPVHGGNIEWNQYAQELSEPNFSSSNCTVEYNDGVATLTNPTARYAAIRGYNYLGDNIKTDHKVLLYCEVKLTQARRPPSLYYNNTKWQGGYSGSNKPEVEPNVWKPLSVITTVKAPSGSTSGVIVIQNDNADYDGYEFSVRNVQFFDLTQMFGAGNEPTTIEEFRTLFPADYYPYNVGETTTVSAVNGDPYRHYSITLPTEAGTVYGGTLNVSTGELVVDRKSVVYDGSNDETWEGLANLPWRYGITANDIKLGNAVSFYVTSNLMKTTAEHWSTANYGILNNMNSIVVGYPPASNDVAAFRAFLSSNPLQVVYLLATPITYTLTPTEIRTLLGTNNVWADTGDVALTYTGTDEHLTLESGKKYLARLSGTDSMLLGSGQEITAAKGTDNVFDLTQMFGTAVADYVYGQGAAFFRKWFPNVRYPYNAGELLSVEGLQSHDMVGFNQWDGEWVQGYWDKDTGVIVSSYNWRACKNFIPVIPNTAYYVKREASITASGGYCIFYDADKNYLTYIGTPKNASFTTPANAYYMTFYMSNSYFDYPICISLAHNNSRNGEYEPYEKHSYPLDSTVILRGIPKVGANGVYWDGDRYLPDGTVERRYGVVDMGTQVWGKNTFNSISYFVTDNILSDLKKPVNSNDDNNFLCTKYPLVKTPGVSTAFTDKTFFVFTSGYIYVRDDSFTDLNSFKSAMSGVLLVYELATSTTETAQPYHSTQWVSDWGTEEFVSTGLVPVGTETRYPANLRDKLQHLPDAASGNGSYLITQTDGQMVLTPFPAPPSSAGNYVLKATVTNGVATYTWEVAT